MYTAALTIEHESVTVHVCSISLFKLVHGGTPSDGLDVFVIMLMNV